MFPNLENCVRKCDSQNVHPETEEEHSQDRDRRGDKKVLVHQEIYLDREDHNLI